MRNWIKTGLAMLVIAASLVFTTIGVARAAAGYSWNPSPPRGVSLFSLGLSSETPTATPTVEPTASPESTEMGESQSPEDDDSQEYSNSQGQDDDMQEDSGSSSEQDDDSEHGTMTSETAHHHSGSHSGSNYGDDDSDGD